MPTFPSILPSDNDPVSLPSLPTQRGGASRPGEPIMDSENSMPTLRGRTAPRGERLRVGDVLLGRYTVLSELGEGGMGVVYKCLDNVGGIEVALKCLPPELSRNEAEMEGIRENYGIVAKLHHSAISGLRNLEKDPDFGEYYLVMDLAEGEDLSQILRRRRGAPMPPQEAFAILWPLASALDYAHSEKVLHRDVKPANVKVDFQGGASRPGEPRVQLLDFGLAAEVRSSMSRVSLRGHAGSSGTPAYMAPEQWEARRQTPATDQYALAVMAYQMLSGYLPFDADDPDLLRRAVLSRAPDPVEGLSPAINAALLRALAKDPKERFGSCGEFVESCLAQRPQGEGGLQTAVTSQGGGGLQTAVSSQGGAGSPGVLVPPDAAAQEAEVLRRKVAMARTLKSLPAEDRSDAGLSAFAEEADMELETAEEAFRYARFAAAAQCLDRADAALRKLAQTKAERKAKAEEEEEERRLSRRTQGGGGLQSAVGQSGARQAGARIAVRVGSRELALRWCPPGSFTMGSPTSEEGRDDDETQHRVTLTTGFWMGETEVTQGLWKGVMGSNPSYSKSGDSYPVENVSWNDCQEFLKKLNARHPQSGLRWALPTEAQWEYACRAGTTGPFAGTGRLDDMGWYHGNSGCETHPVAQKRANAWGLHDMHGNVWEWCADWYGSYPDGAVTDPTGPASGVYRVLRGGGCWRRLRFCRSAYRRWNAPGNRGVSRGLRLVAFQEAGARSAVRENRGHGKVQLWAGGPYWAETNIGAEKPEDSGLYFLWGDTVGYRREGNAWVASDGSSRNFSFDVKNMPTYRKSPSTLSSEGRVVSKGGTTVLAPMHDAAQAHWDGNWRMPTKQELSDLVEKCDWTWTTRNGVDGYVVRGRGAYAGASIFLPAAGLGVGTSLSNAGSYGYFWSSVPLSGSNRSSWSLSFYSGGHGSYNVYRSRGQPVRPVQGFTE